MTANQSRGLLIRGLILIIVLVAGWALIQKRAEMTQPHSPCAQAGWKQFHADGYTFCYPPDVFGVVVLDNTIKLTGFFVVNDGGKPRTCTITLQSRPGQQPEVHQDLVPDSLHPPIPEKRQRELVTEIAGSIH